VSGVRVDHAAGEFGLPGVWEGDGGGAVVLFVASWWAAAFLACAHLFFGEVSQSAEVRRVWGLRSYNHRPLQGWFRAGLF
jgi:hypothetical protein